MSSVCFYFEVHQPYRVRAYDVFEIGKNHDYFDEKLTREVMRKVAMKCYLPANAAMLRLIERYDGRFRIAYSITGVALEQSALVHVEVPVSDTDCEVAEGITGNLNTASKQSVALHRSEGTIISDDVGDRIRRRHAHLLRRET